MGMHHPVSGKTYFGNISSVQSHSNTGNMRNLHLVIFALVIVTLAVGQPQGTRYNELLAEDNTLEEDLDVAPSKLQGPAHGLCTAKWHISGCQVNQNHCVAPYHPHPFFTLRHGCNCVCQ